MNEQYFTSLNGYIVKDPKSIHTYNTVLDMKSDIKLKDGDFVKTKGYYNVNDGGSAEYYIRNKTNEDIEDNGLIHFITDYVVAELLVKDDKINVKQFGAKGDGETDDTNVLKSLFNSARDYNITTIYFPVGRYLVTDTLLDYGIDGLTIRGEKYDIYNSSIILRGADCTVFNFGGVMELTGISYRSSDIVLDSLTFRDNEETYTNNVFATFHYSQHCSILNCTISCRNKALDLKHLYDSRFINTDFTAGGNSNDAMITIHGGKHASPNEIGWDSANCITFECCRFERYYGSAIKTTSEVQPDTNNPIYDPAVAINVNTIWFDMCRFEAPTLLTGKHLDFNSTNNIRLNIQMTILDGQTGLKPINFNKCIGVFGKISVGYNQSTVGGATFADFEEPIINITNNSGKFDLDLMVTNIYTHYLLDYFVNVIAGDNTRRTINMNLIFNGLNKKLYNQGSGNQNLNIYKQGRTISYGQYENGYGTKTNNEVNNQYFNNMSYDSTNERYTNDNKYTNTSNSNRTLDSYISDDNYSFHRHEYPQVMNNTLLIAPSKYPSNKMSNLRSNGTNTRAIMYDSTYPTTEQTDVLFKAGDIIFNTTPTAGGNVGWVCTTSGNPGTWKAFGTIES